LLLNYAASQEALPRTRAVLSPTTGWDSLTKAERRVATLISQGHTNRSAASSLGVSANTVSTHLRAVFAKLGVQSRVQLANCLASYASQARPSRYDGRGRVQPTPDREGADVVVRAGPVGNGLACSGAGAAAAGGPASSAIVSLLSSVDNRHNITQVVHPSEHMRGLGLGRSAR
jgi:DNA-binding CsgD family transcriptional regulator